MRASFVGEWHFVRGLAAEVPAGVLLAAFVGVDFYSEVGDQSTDFGVRFVHPLAPDVENDAVKLHYSRSSAGPVAGFEHQHVEAGFPQFAGRR